MAGRKGDWQVSRLRGELTDNLNRGGIHVAQTLTAYGIALDVIGVPVTSNEEGRSGATELDEFHTLAPEGTRTSSEVERICKPENLVPSRHTKRKREKV